METSTIPVVNKKQWLWMVYRKRPNKGNERGQVTLIQLPVLEMLGVRSRTRVEKTPLTQVSDRRGIVTLNSQIVPTVGGIDGVIFKP